MTRKLSLNFEIRFVPWEKFYSLPILQSSHFGSGQDQGTGKYWQQWSAGSASSWPAGRTLRLWLWS